MVADLVKPLLVLFVFLIVIKDSERQFAIAKSVHNVDVASPSIRGMQVVEDRCKPNGSSCMGSSECCSGRCLGEFVVQFHCYPRSHGKLPFDSRAQRKLLSCYM